MTAVHPTLLPRRDRPAKGVARLRFAPPASDAFALWLLRERLVAPHDLIRALSLAARRRAALAEILRAEGLISEATLQEALARHLHLLQVDPLREPPDPRLIDCFGARACLREGVLPWRQAGGATVVLCARPGDFDRQRQRLESLLGKVVPALAPRPAIEAAVLAARGRFLGELAETRVPETESCRAWGGHRLPRLVALLLAALLACALLAPVAAIIALSAWAVLTLVLTSGLKLAAALASLRNRAEEAPPLIARLPMVSIIVALYHEADIAGRLVIRLARLDYPRDLLEVLLVVEASDEVTRKALEAAALPPWMRVVISPQGRLKTKPRALNVALDHCRGSIVGVYDAEDAPAADQIRRVVDRFHQRGPQVACLQGMLDYYNPRTNWLSRCFTIEYAGWFRIVLPGLERLGLVVPLGGTTLFFRREALESLGGWDAHNVTEDADLGIRLARHGYRTELIDTVTCEEANCLPLPWIKQRSRWIKGYMMTWAVHMRDPMLLWRQIGPWRFAGFQVLFLGSLSQTLLAPVLWSFWLMSLGLPHPVSALLPLPAVVLLIALFLLSEAVNITVGIAGLRRTRHRLSAGWVPTLHLYHPLAALASYKAAWEMIVAPFYWDKTSHGRFDPAEQWD